MQIKPKPLKLKREKMNKYKKIANLASVLEQIENKIKFIKNENNTIFIAEVNQDGVFNELSKIDLSNQSYFKETKKELIAYLKLQEKEIRRLFHNEYASLTITNPKKETKETFVKEKE